MCMFGTNAGIVKPGGNGIYRSDLSVFILAEIGFHAMEYAQLSCCYGSGGLRSIDTAACCLTPDQAYVFILLFGFLDIL